MLLPHVLGLLAVAVPAYSQTDTAPPTITSFVLDSTTVTPTSARMTVTFSEPVTGVDQTDFVINPTPNTTATITGVTPGGSAATYHVNFTYSGASGSLQMAIKTTATGIADAAGNPFVGNGSAATVAYPVNNAPPTDMTLPTVSSFAPPGGSLTSPTSLSLVFSKVVTGVSAEDFIASSGATVGTVTGSGTNWTVPVTFTGTGPVTLTLVGGASTNIRDNATHWFAGGTPGATVTFTPGTTGGAIAPVISSPLTATVVAGAPFSYTITGTNSPTSYTATVLPAGLTFTSPTITGSVAVPGTYNIALGAANTAGADSKTLVLTVSPQSTVDTRIVSVTPPPNGAFGVGQTLSIAVSFNGPVTVSPSTGGADLLPYISWNARPGAGQTTPGSSGRLRYTSGSGTSVLTFTYTVQSGDVAPLGIELGTMVQLPSGATIMAANGGALTGSALTLPWTTNVLPGVILNPPVTNPPGPGSGSGPVITIKRGDGLLPGQPFTLPSTTASGQPITWILVSGNATLQGNVLTPKNRGAVVVRAIVAGSNPAQASTIAQYEIETDEIGNGRGKGPHKDRLSNLSSRLRVASNDPSRSAVAGFVITGSASKQVLVRAIGPGLSAFGVAEAVSGAWLQLYDQSGRVIAQNDGWNNDSALAVAAERVGAFKLAAGSRDSALLVTLPPGAYTAQVGATGNGIALIEVYDASSAAVLSSEQLINISTRGFVDSGDGKLIAGFVVSGDAPKRLLVRGIGASLTGFGVPGALANPVLELYTAGGATLIARNDDWGTPQSLAPASPAGTASEIVAAAQATGAFPLESGSKDAAILITLMPGSYSVVVSGANQTTGAGLVEVYEVLNP